MAAPMIPSPFPERRRLWPLVIAEAKTAKIHMSGLGVNQELA